MISHLHGDHCGGQPIFVEKSKIGQLVGDGYKKMNGGEIEGYRKNPR